jgi:hypothetical protein
MTTVPLIVAAIAAATAHPQRQESNIRETSDALTLWTADGLGLGLSRADGTAAELQIGERILPLAAVPVVVFEEVIEHSPAPDLIGDGDFRAGSGGWNLTGATLEPPRHTGGGRWLRVDGNADQWPRRVVTLNQATPQPVIVSGRCRAEMHTSAAGWLNARLAINVVGVYANGGRMPEQSAYFGQYRRSCARTTPSVASSLH